MSINALFEPAVGNFNKLYLQCKYYVYNICEVIFMAKTTAVNMRVDADLKHQAEILCDNMGLTLSSVFTLLLKAIVRTRSIPFKIEASNLDTDCFSATIEKDNDCN